MIRTFGSRFILQSSLDEFGFTADEVDGLQLKRTEDIFTGKLALNNLIWMKGKVLFLATKNKYFTGIVKKIFSQISSCHFMKTVVINDIDYIHPPFTIICKIYNILEI